MKNIKQWYRKAHPTDVLGFELTECRTFDDLYTSIILGDDIYSFLGVNDSLVRERVFLELSNVYNTGYETIYKTWIYNLK